MISLKCWYKGHNYGVDESNRDTSLRYCLRYNCTHQQHYQRHKGWVTLGNHTKTKRLANATH